MIRGLWAAGAALFLASSAHASLSACAGSAGCTFPVSTRPADNFEYFDYTVPPDGSAYLWTLRLSDPAATMTLNRPNQVEAFTKTKTADGYTPGYLSKTGFAWTFDEFVEPGLTTIRVQAPRPFDGCATARIGDLCAVSYNVWGNGTFLTFSSAQPTLTMWFSQTGVPEPGAWAMLLAGFGLMGAAQRRRRAAVN